MKAETAITVVCTIVSVVAALFSTRAAYEANRISREQTLISREANSAHIEFEGPTDVEVIVGVCRTSTPGSSYSYRYYETSLTAFLKNTGGRSVSLLDVTLSGGNRKWLMTSFEQSTVLGLPADIPSGLGRRWKFVGQSLIKEKEVNNEPYEGSTLTWTFYFSDRTTVAHNTTISTVSLTFSLEEPPFCDKQYNPFYR